MVYRVRYGVIAKVLTFKDEIEEHLVPCLPEACLHFIENYRTLQTEKLEAVLKWFQKLIIWNFRDSFDFGRRSVAGAT
mgnify:CR=1 FL=1